MNAAFETKQETEERTTRDVQPKPKKAGQRAIEEARALDEARRAANRQWVRENLKRYLRKD